METFNYHELAALAAVLNELKRRAHERGRASGPDYQVISNLLYYIYAVADVDAATFFAAISHKSEAAAALMANDWEAPLESGEESE